MKVSKFYLNYITILFIAFLYTGYSFLQIDRTSGVSAMSRTYNSIIGLIALISMVAFIVTNYKNIVFKKSIVLGVVITWIILIIIQTILTGDGLERIIINFYYVTIWPVSFVFFYLLSIKTSSSDSDIIVTRLIFLSVISLLLYYIMAKSSFALLGESIGSIGSSYYLLCFLPWLFLEKNKNLRYILLALFLFTILLSSKRTSIIAAGLFILVYIITATRNRNVVNRFFLVCVIAVLIFYLFYYVDQNVMGGHITERFSNFERGADTRDEIRGLTLALFYNSSLYEQLIGHGYNTVITTNPLELSAHNDYVETLYDHGLILFILQIIFVIRLYYLSFKLYKNKSSLFPPLFASVNMYVLMAYTTHLILYPYYFCFLTGFWGYVEGKFVHKRNNLAYKYMVDTVPQSIS